MNQAADTIASEYTAIDILVNNAGISHIGTEETTKEEDFEWLLSVNEQGVYNCLHAVLPATKGGVILNPAPVASSSGLAERFAYSVTKGAVAGMTLSVSKIIRPQYPLQLRITWPGPHTFCGWIFIYDKSRQRTGDV